ncbi:MULTISPECIES: hypothetical protein [unclassified Micromonospora]|uniref:hypothetical protein n=1 Tax=unclassified Micromonospora TaxID=2617518 RepID=UPI003625C46A
MVRQVHRTRQSVCLTTLIACGVLLAGCDGQTGEGPGDSGPSPTATRDPRPLKPEGLIGNWTLADVDEPGAGTVLRLAPQELDVVGSRCGTLGGAWRADPDGLFLASIHSAFTYAVEGIPGCARASQDTPDWLRRVTAYRFDDGGRPVLLDDLAQPVARLIPGATPTAGPDMLDSALAPPVVTDEARRDLAATPALPATLTPVDPHRLARHWVPVSGHRAAYVKFTAGGGWHGSDGCNDSRGRWLTAPGGALLATVGAVTLVGCESVPVDHWLSTARRAGFDGADLVLLDVRGRETGRLRATG